MKEVAEILRDMPRGEIVSGLAFIAAMIALLGVWAVLS